MKFISVFPGVANIINKLNGLPFDENDEQLFEVSSQYSFCLHSLCVWPQCGTTVGPTGSGEFGYIYSNYRRRSADPTSTSKGPRMMM
jgi:hypothetical protein